MLKPQPKVAAGGAAGAAAVLIIFFAGLFGESVDPEVAASAVLFVTFLAAYFKKA